MSLNKNGRIVELLDYLELKKRGWIIVDPCEGKLDAVGLASAHDGRRLVYVSTYGKAFDKFDFECEASCRPYLEEFELVYSGENVDLVTLVDVLINHLSPHDDDDA